MSFFKKLFGSKEEPAHTKPSLTDEQHQSDYDQKVKGLEAILGNMHGIVRHAIIPFAVGGAVDMYYFPDHIKGTGFATMELLEPDGSGPLQNRLGTYELVAFTKHPISDIEGEGTAFNRIERQICGIFTKIGFFSRQAVLNPNETCEVQNKEGEPNTCLVLDHYAPDKAFTVGDRSHHLLLCLQVFRSEMEFARAAGTKALLAALKNEGHYPYSDLDRKPVA